MSVYDTRNTIAIIIITVATTTTACTRVRRRSLSIFDFERLRTTRVGTEEKKHDIRRRVGGLRRVDRGRGFVRKPVRT